jgi:hypothetical protein
VCSALPARVFDSSARVTTPREGDRRTEAEPGEFHDVHAQPEAYDHYLRTDRCPALTVPVMDVYEARERDARGIVSKGLFPGRQRRFEVAVRNARRRTGRGRTGSPAH